MLLNIHRDAGLRDFLKTLRLARQGVSPDFHGSEDVRAVSTRGGGYSEALFFIGQRHFRAGNHGSTLVLDGAENGAGVNLSEEMGGNQKCQRRRKYDEPQDTPARPLCAHRALLSGLFCNVAFTFIFRLCQVLTPGGAPIDSNHCLTLCILFREYLIRCRSPTASKRRCSLRRRPKVQIRRLDSLAALMLLAACPSSLAPHALDRAPAGAPATRLQGESMSPSLTYTSRVEIWSKSLKQDFAPDGDLDKRVWRNASWKKFDRDMSGKIRYPQAEVRVASLWTARYVYFAFRCRYVALNVYEGEDAVKERWELWNRDVVEVFANPEPERVNHYYEFEVAPNNQWIDLEIDKDKDPFNDAKWDSHFAHATRIDAKRHVWTCEMRIPISAIAPRPVAVRPGTKWRINFFR